MNKKDQDFLLTLGGLALLGWLLSKDKYKCPRCNNPVTRQNYQCPNCGQPLNWEAGK